MIQLDKIVEFHKALADPNRIRILLLLSEGELNGQTLAEKLGVSTPTITHHCAKLRLVGLIDERRDKNTIYFRLGSKKLLEHNSNAISQYLFKNKQEIDHRMDNNAKLTKSVLNNFFSADEKLLHIPSQLKKKLIVLEHLVQGLELGRAYSEKEINEYIKNYHEDFATIRREFVMHRFMYRENGIYELNPRELWAKMEDL